MKRLLLAIVIGLLLSPAAFAQNYAVYSGSITSGDCPQFSGTSGQTVSIACASGGVAAYPQGRLTLVSGTPIITTNQAGIGTIYYDSFRGNQVPVYNGSAVVNLSITSNEISDVLNSGSVTASGNVYDLYIVSVSGQATLCNSAAWQTPASTRGTGTVALHTGPGGYLTNSASLTHCYNDATDEGPIATDQATYVGSFTSTAAAQTTFQVQPTAVAGGESCTMGLWNAYNQVPMSCVVQDAQANWTYTPGTSYTWRWADTPNGPHSQIVWVDGNSQSAVLSKYRISGECGCVLNFLVGVDVDGTTSVPSAPALSSSTGSASQSSEVVSDTLFTPQIGLHTLYPVETTNSASNATTFVSTLNGGAEVVNAFSAYIPM